MAGLALIAGRGRLPEILAEAARPMVVGLEGALPERLATDRTFRLEHLGSLIASLRESEITEVVFAGAISRVPLDPGAIDAATLPLVPRMMAALGAGDDAALRTVIAIFEDAGFRVRAAHELVPDLLPDAGCLTSTAPDQMDEADVTRAMAVLAALGPADVGQGCVVHRGQVLTIEAAFGTQWMLEALRARPDAATGGGVFCKAPKPGQDRRIDLPAIGPDTVGQAVAAGLRGIAVEAGGVMVLDPAETVAAAESAGLFLWVRPAS